MRVNVYNWRFEDGNTIPNPDSQWPLPPPARGWYCWAYTDTYRQFEKWLKDSMQKDYDLSYRWNSGAPMISIFLSDDQDAAVFSLRWL